MNNLKKCPWCTSDGYVEEGRFGFFIQCDDCLARGPEADSSEKAAQLWNHPKGQYKISACYYLNDGTAELTYESEDGRECVLRVDVTPEEGESLAAVVGPCSYHRASLKEINAGSLTQWIRNKLPKNSIFPT